MIIKPQRIVIMFIGLLLVCLNLSALAMDWETQTVDADGATGMYPSLVLDPQGRPCVSYCGNDSTLKYAWFTGSSWSSEMVTSGVKGSTSLALDSNDDPHISYIDTDNHLRHAMKIGSSWTLDTVDSAHGFVQYTSIAIDSYDKVHIVYQDYNNAYLRHAVSRGSDWDIDVIDTTASTHRSVIAIDGDNDIHVAYHDSDTDDILHAELDFSSLNWHIDKVMDGDIQGGDIGLVLDSDDDAHICAGLTYAWYSGSAWSTETFTSPLSGTVDWISLDLFNDEPSVGFNQGQSLGFAVRDNGTWEVDTAVSANAGDYNSMVLDDDGNPHIVYFKDDTEDLIYIKGTPTPDPDSDADGLLDAWEITNFGDLLQDEDDDPDGDTYDNLAEFLASTDPNDSTDFPSAETDGDLLPDDWEMANFGNLEQVETGDPDGDGFDNIAEYWAGTNPLDSASYPGATDDPGSSNATWVLLALAVIAVVVVIVFMMFFRKPKDSTAQAPTMPTCPFCEQPSTYVPEEGKYYCNNCGKYL